jgi:hypothetical protein
MILIEIKVNKRKTLLEKRKSLAEVSALRLYIDKISHFKGFKYGQLILTFDFKFDRIGNIELNNIWVVQFKI